MAPNWARDRGQGTGGSRQVVGLVYNGRQAVYTSREEAHRISKECVEENEDIKQTGRGRSLLGTKVERDGAVLCCAVKGREEMGRSIFVGVGLYPKEWNRLILPGRCER